jgi:hypothetical protein
MVRQEPSPEGFSQMPPNPKTENTQSEQPRSASNDWESWWYAAIEAIETEAQACGAVYAVLIQPGTEQGAYIDRALTVRPRAKCLACECRPDIPAAYVSILARDSASMILPIPICDECGRRKSTEQLQTHVRKFIDDWIPRVDIEFVEAAL